MPKIVRKNKITLDDFAAMCMREFTRIHEKFANMEEKMATKEDLLELEFRMDKRFDRVEMILSDHTFRIERLEHAVELD